MEESRLSFRQYWGAHRPPEKQEAVEQLMFLSWIVSWSRKLREGKSSDFQGKALKREEQEDGYMRSQPAHVKLP